jgi:hypothetical protein
VYCFLQLVWLLRDSELLYSPKRINPREYLPASLLSHLFCSNFRTLANFVEPRQGFFLKDITESHLLKDLPFLSADDVIHVTETLAVIS